MTARDRLRRASYNEHFIDLVLKEHAHELAEKQREMLFQGFQMEPYASVTNALGETEAMGTTHVIDHIDPDITEVRPARVAIRELYAREVSDGEG